MKTSVSTVFAVFSMVFVGVSAQVATVGGALTVTQYFSSVCTTPTATSYTATVTGTIQLTECPLCSGVGAPGGTTILPSTSTTLPYSVLLSSALSSSAAAGAGTLTTYTTVYTAICSTASGGLAPVTYTVTEPCPTSGVPRPSTYIPQAFTVVTVSCPICQGMPSVTLTTPIATQTPAPAAANPAASGSSAIGGSVPAPAGSPAPSSPAATAPPAPPAGSAAAPPVAPPVAAPSNGTVASGVGGPSPAAPSILSFGTNSASAIAISRSIVLGALSLFGAYLYGL